MKLTKQIKLISDHLRDVQVFDGKDPLDISRKSYESMAVQLGGKKEAVREIEEFDIMDSIHQIPVRLYRPKGIKTDKVPAIIYLHGGWFISGGFETHDAIVRKLANATKMTVIFIDYRLAPEHPFPAGLEDCITVTNWLFENGEAIGVDTRKVSIIGDSAGGALAAALTNQFRGKIQHQVLIYPAADNSLDTKSWKTYANGPVLSKEGGLLAWNWYLPDAENRKNPLAVPILIKDYKGTPPTLVILAGHDPLHDEGEQLAQNMEVAGIKVKVSNFKDMVHGFMHMGGVLTETQSAINEIAGFIN